MGAAVSVAAARRRSANRSCGSVLLCSSIMFTVRLSMVSETPSWDETASNAS